MRLEQSKNLKEINQRLDFLYLTSQKVIMSSVTFSGRWCLVRFSIAANNHSAEVKVVEQNEVNPFARFMLLFILSFYRQNIYSVFEN